MKPKHLWIVMAVLAMLVACNGRREASVTGAYGPSVLAGEVFVTDGSPAGVEVSVRGTGMSMTVGEAGEFAFANAPRDAELDFRRADGIEASLRVDGSGFVSVELDRNNATARRKSSKRRSAGGTRDIHEFEGVIRATGAGSVVVFTSHKVEQEIALIADTVIRKGAATLTPADLTVGARVHVRAKKSGETYTAVLVIVQNTSDDEDGGGDGAPATREYEGSVRSATATTLVVFTSHREEVTFTLTADTVIRKGNTPIAAAELQAGWRVHVKATTSADGTATATRVTVQNSVAESVRLSGTVASVSSTALVVTTSTGSVTVRTTAATQIRKGGKKSTLASIAAGDEVEVEGTRVDATTVEAKKIDVRS